MNTLPVTLLYNPLTERFYCPNVEVPSVSAGSYTGLYNQCFVSQANYSDGKVGYIIFNKRHNFAKTVAVWRVKPATGSIEERLAARKGVHKVVRVSSDAKELSQQFINLFISN